MSDLFILGNGITGAFTAYLLARHGIHATVVGNTDLHRASHINPGGINPLHGPGIPGVMEAFSLQAYHLHLNEWQTIAALSGIDFRGRIIDRLLLAFTAEEKAALLQNRMLYEAAAGFSARWLEPAEVAALDSRLTADSLGGLHTHGNATVDAERYSQALLAAAQALGATVVNDTIDSVHITAGGYCLQGRQQRYAAGRLVVATGAYSGNLLHETGLSLPVKPVKGELLQVRLSTPLHFDITREKDGLYQFHGNLYWLGGTREDAGFDYSTPAAHAETILDQVALLVPGIRDYAIEAHQAALRPGTPDGLPILGSPAGHPQLFIATGGGSKGMLWSAGMAAAVVHWATGTADTITPAGVSPDRFTQRN